MLSDRRNPGQSSWLLFGVTSSALLLVSIDGTVVATALPTLSHQLGASITWTTWTISAYGLGTVTGLPLAGRLSDELGRKRMFIAFAAIFAVASLCCGLVSNIFALVALRFVQSLGGSGLMPSTTGVISDVFGQDRDRPIGLMTSIFPLGAMLGPALGGVIVTFYSWRLIFLINVPICAFLIAVLWRLLPPDRIKVGPRLNIDILGSFLFALALLGLMLGLSEMGELGQRSPLPWSVLAVSLLCWIGFAYRQKTSHNPILPMEMLRERAFVVVNGLNLLYGAAAIGVFSLVPLFAQSKYGMSPLQAGALLIVRAGAMAVVAAASSLFVIRRYGYRRPIMIGFGILAVGLLMLAAPVGVTAAFGWLSLACIIGGLGVGLAGPPSNNAALELMPNDVAVISGLRAMFRQSGSIVAISITGAAIGASGRAPTVLPFVFGSLALLTLVSVPAILGVPESHRHPATDPQAVPGT